jgi:hypothetical protein
MNSNAPVTPEQFRSRGPVIAVIGALLSLGFIALALHRGGWLDWIAFAPLAAAMGLLAAAAATGLRYRVGADHVEVRVLNVALTRIPTGDITRVESEQVSPVRRYGGWGIRGTRQDRAYLVGRGRGVRLHLRDRQVFLGYDDAEALRNSIRRRTHAGP